MNLRIAYVPLTLALAALAACYTGSAVDTNRPPATDTDGTNPPPGSGGADEVEGGTNKSPVKPMGLPCDVAELITSSCAECHGSTPSGGAPNRLLTYEDFSASIEGDEGTSMAEASLLRMKSTKRPMPPTGKLAPEKIAVFERWVSSGLPRGSCGEPKPDDDGGAPSQPDSGGKDAGGPDASSVCSSGTFSPQSTGASALMKPGRACIKCHSATGGPAFELAGTVYEELHEPNDCHGAANVKVLIIDATGATHTMTTNAAGNFTRLTSIARPYRAMIIKGNSVREMKTPQTDGDCNGCHTEWGNRAPGRIMVP